MSGWPISGNACLIASLTSDEPDDFYGTDDDLIDIGQPTERERAYHRATYMNGPGGAATPQGHDDPDWRSE